MVFTNDEKLKEFQLTVKFEPFIPKGYRVGSYLFDPTNEIQATIAPGQVYEGRVGIYFSSNQVVAIQKTVADNPAFTTTVETVSPGREFTLRVKSTAPLSAGKHKLQAKLLTNDPNQEVLEVAFLVLVGSSSDSQVPAQSTQPAQSPSKNAGKKVSRKVKK